MAQSLLLDTDFPIDFLRGQGQAVAFMEEESRPMAVSALTIPEKWGRTPFSSTRSDH